MVDMLDPEFPAEAARNSFLHLLQLPFELLTFPVQVHLKRLELSFELILKKSLSSCELRFRSSCPSYRRMIPGLDPTPQAGDFVIQLGDAQFQGVIVHVRLGKALRDLLGRPICFPPICVRSADIKRGSLRFR
jgi:hypothetical protein